MQRNGGNQNLPLQQSRMIGVHAGADLGCRDLEQSRCLGPEGLHLCHLIAPVGRTCCLLGLPTPSWQSPASYACSLPTAHRLQEEEPRASPPQGKKRDGGSGIEQGREQLSSSSGWGRGTCTPRSFARRATTAVCLALPSRQ